MLCVCVCVLWCFLAFFVFLLVSGSTANITLDGSPERVFYGATSLTFSVGCEEGQLFKNGSLEERRIFNRSDENETGIYQCISTPDETATDLLYVAVACELMGCSERGLIPRAHWFIWSCVLFVCLFGIWFVQTFVCSINS